MAGEAFLSAVSSRLDSWNLERLPPGRVPKKSEKSERRGFWPAPMALQVLKF